jgi:hypothetical protein
MVDRVYRSDLPRLRATLLGLRDGFSRIESSTDWVRLRIDPLLSHVERLEKMVRVWESSRLSGGVPMLHSDLVYFRQNVVWLKQALVAETRRSQRRRKVP